MPAKLTVYGLKNCDSCRKTLKLIRDAGKEAAFVDVRETPLSAGRLQRWYREFGQEALLNKRSTTWRNLSTAQKDVENERAALALISAFPTVMKRPVIEAGRRAMIGFNAGQILDFVK